MTYTQLALCAVPLAVAMDLAFARTRLLRTTRFWWTYAIVAFFQLLTNGWLTGRQIVRYDADSVLGGGDPVFVGSWRVLWAPVEDLAFGFALVVWTLVVWTWLRARFPGPLSAVRARRERA